MNQLQLIIGNCQSDEKAAAQGRYLSALLLCSLLLIGFSAGVFGWKPLVLALIAGVAGSVVEFAFSAVRKKPVTGGAFVYGLALSLLVPPTMPWWVILLAAIAGTVSSRSNPVQPNHGGVRVSRASSFEAMRYSCFRSE